MLGILQLSEGAATTLFSLQKKGGEILLAYAGTQCEGKVQGFLAKKIGDCQKCDFFIQVIARQL